MNTRRWFLGACALAVWGNCIGGAIGVAARDQPDAQPRSGPLANVNRLNAPASPAITIEQLMDWAERKYPDLFPGHSSTMMAAPYLYRYYPQTQNYIGVDGQDVYVLGPISGNSLLGVGSMSGFGCAVLPGDCQAKAPKVFAGAGISAVIDAGGVATFWGSTSGFRMPAGTPIDTGSSVTARRLAFPVKQMVFGESAGLLLHSDGRVFEWGNKAARWLTREESTEEPMPVPTPGKAKQV